MIAIGYVGLCLWIDVLLKYRLLLVDGDIACFPRNTLNTCARSFSDIKYESISHSIQQPSQLLNAVSDIICIKEAPIISFFNHIFSSSSMHDDNNQLNFKNRIIRWIHGDLSQQGFSNKNDNTSDNVNSKGLNYSAYNVLFHNHYVGCTIISWIMVLVLLILRITSIHFSTFRMVFVTFFVCPFAVAVLETGFQYLYLAYTIGHWKYLKVIVLLPL